MRALVVDDAVVSFPYFDSDLRRDNPLTSFPSPIDDQTRLDFGVVEVLPTAVPWGKRVVSTTAEVVDGVAREVHELVDAPLEELRAEKLAEVVLERWARETAGFVWSRPGTEEVYFVATDAVSQAKIAAERKAADEGRRRPGDVWKCGDPATGDVVYPTLSDSDVVDLSDAARDRVCDCFNREAALAALVAAAETVDDLVAIDVGEGWPA